MKQIAMKQIALLTAFVLLIFGGQCSAQVRTFHAESSYLMDRSKPIKIAPDFAKQNAAEQAGISDEELLVEQERINREFLSMQKLETFGNKLGASKNFKYDMNIIDRAIKINPKNVAVYVTHAYVYVNRAICYETPGDNDKALADFNKALEFDPNDKIAKNNRQRVLDKLKK